MLPRTRQLRTPIAALANQAPALNAIQARGRRLSTMPYFSRVVFSVAQTGASPNFTYTLAQGTVVRAFSYGVSQDMASAGLAGTIATPCDTNLTSPGKTLGGQDVHIYGISVIANPVTDFELLRRSVHLISVQIGLNGDDATLKLGTILNLPGIGGLQGWGDTQLTDPPLANTQRNMTFLGHNGVPAASNFRQIPEGFIWRKEGETDSQLNIKFTAERAVVINGLATRAAAAGVGAFAPPTSVVLDFTVHLLCAAESNQSANL